MDNNENSPAVDSLYKAQSLKQDDSNILVKLGLGFFKLDENERATEYLEKALSLNP